MKTVLSILTIYLGAIYYAAFCQDMIFNPVPPPKGLFPATLAGVQDLQGYMWMGTFQSGLRRYDGYRYTLYSNDPLNPNSLADNSTGSLCADSKGFIWIGTPGYGLDRLDPATGNFMHFRSDPKNPNSLSNNTVKALLEDREGMLWIGTHEGLNRYDPKTGKFQHYHHQWNNPSSLSCNHIEKIYEDRQGTLWVGTGDAWKGGGCGTAEGGLNRFDKKSGKFIRYVHEPDNPHSLINNKVKAILEDSHGTFWVGTGGDGLHTMNRADGTFQRHQYDPAHPKGLSRPPQKKIRTQADDHITFIIEDVKGGIWIGTFGNGLNRYDPETKRVTHYPNFKDPVSGVELEVAAWACNTRDGILWIGYWRGLYRIDPWRRNIPFVATGTPVSQILEDKFGMLWYGGVDGLVRKDQKNGTVQRFAHDPRNPRSISDNKIVALHQDRQGVLWIGTGNGLNRFDHKTATFDRHVFKWQGDSSLINKEVGSIYEDRKGDFWFGIAGAGVIRKNTQTNTFTHYRHDPEDTTSFSKGNALRFYEDRSGNLWIGNWVDGLHRFIPQTGKFQHFLNRANIHDLRQDSEGILWVGTSAGLYKSNPEMSAFSLFTGPNGEFENVVANGILEDDQKTLWINSSIGICRLNPQRNKVELFSRSKDPSSHNGMASYIGKSGEFFFGGVSGYFKFFPEQLTKKTNAPQIVLSAFRIGDQPVLPGKGSPLKGPLQQIKEIGLHHDQNVFSFDFAGIHYSSPEHNQHFFMLENLDNTWRKAGEEKTAYYFNVPPGEYVFRVKAANSDGVWAERAVTIYISPPWWLTPWAYGGYLIMALGFLYGLRQYTVKRERLKHDLEIQRMEAEKMHEIDHLKSRFFANISHEFRTPLTLILGPLEKFLSQSSTPDDNKPVYRMMQRNAQRLLHLINQLLDLSKLETGNMQLEAKPASLSAFLKTLVSSFTSLAEIRQIQYHFKYFTGNPTVFFDADKLEKIVTNLLSNAFKFTPAGGSISISALFLKPEQGLQAKSEQGESLLTTLEIKVQDNGLGIPDDQLEKIFNRFYQTDTSHKEAKEGSGIGLALVRELVELHGGKVMVESQLGKGTGFTIHLSLQVTDFEEESIVEHGQVGDRNNEDPYNIAFEDEPSDLAELSTEMGSIDEPMILIVEDNTDIRHFLRENLHNYRVIEAEEGESAYNIASETIPDLIISDVMMPKMDGVELCSQVEAE